MTTTKEQLVGIIEGCNHDCCMHPEKLADTILSRLRLDEEKVAESIPITCCVDNITGEVSYEEGTQSPKTFFMTKDYCDAIATALANAKDLFTFKEGTCT